MKMPRLVLLGDTYINIEHAKTKNIQTFDRSRRKCNWDCDSIATGYGEHQDTPSSEVSRWAQS